MFFFSNKPYQKDLFCIKLKQFQILVTIPINIQTKDFLVQFMIFKKYKYMYWVFMNIENVKKFNVNFYVEQIFALIFKHFPYKNKKIMQTQNRYLLEDNKVVLEPRVSPENTSKSVDTVTFLQKLEPKVIDP